MFPSIRSAQYLLLAATCLALPAFAGQPNPEPTPLPATLEEAHERIRNLEAEIRRLQSELF